MVGREVDGEEGIERGADRAGRWPLGIRGGGDLGLRPRLVWSGPLALGNRLGGET